MEWKLFVQLAATFIVAALGWYAAHYFSSKRDATNERRKMRIEYLLAAYRRLENASHRAGNEQEYWVDLESAISDIQLLGSEHQAELAKKFAREMAENNVAQLNELLNDLRFSLRHELFLEPISGNPLALRFHQHGRPRPIIRFDSDQ